MLIVSEKESEEPYVRDVSSPIESRDVRLTVIYANYVVSDLLIDGLIRSSGTPRHDSYHQFSSDSRENPGPAQFSMPMRLTGLFASQLVMFE